MIFDSTIGLGSNFRVFGIPGTASVDTAGNIDFGVISVVSRYPGTVMGGTRVRIVNFAGNRELAILLVAENCVVKVNLGDIKGENLIPQPRSELSVCFELPS